ncbi:MULTISPECIES: hypothetical protein [Gulosibacter]|uniref:hypothetical protein n=1 Tax=Gulosibacter TaxID=256818 RepID=UPI00191A3015|nr:hypothetical protein [Gulosibacter hominis]
MIEWYTWLQFGIGALAGIICLVQAFRNRPPGDFTAGSVAVVALLALVQLVLAIVAPLWGNVCLGDGLEFWMYQVALVIFPLGGILWALIDRGRWANAVLGIAALSASVMVFRMQQIWLGNAPLLG